jgi:hypothetical protein
LRFVREIFGPARELLFARLFVLPHFALTVDREP